MKYLLSMIALVVCCSLSAQTFQWNDKGGATNPKEVQPAGDLEAYEKAYNERQTGLVGIYSPNLHNSRTVYGETYNSAELTASHGILPLGTLVKVTNLDNGRNLTVRVNDRGQECADCLLTLSQTAADVLGVTYRGRVSVERVGFSNWNPAPPQSAYQSAPVYGPTVYASTPAAGGVVRPSTAGDANNWQARGGQSAPATYGSVPTYGQPAPPAPQPTYQPQAYGQQPTYQPAPVRNEVAVLGAPSVMSREVDPATRANQPTTYSRRATVVTPQASTPVYQPQTYQQPTYQPQAYGQQPTYQQPAPAQAVPVQTVPQAAPPQPTVPRYQAKGGAATPQSYGQPVRTTAPATTAAPTAYANVPAAATGPSFAVQLAAYNNELYAKTRVDNLKAAGMTNVFYRTMTKPDGQVINRVYAGTFASMAAAQAAANDIRTQYQIAGIATRMQ